MNNSVYLVAEILTSLWPCLAGFSSSHILPLLPFFVLHRLSVDWTLRLIFSPLEPMHCLSPPPPTLAVTMYFASMQEPDRQRFLYNKHKNNVTIFRRHYSQWEGNTERYRILKSMTNSGNHKEFATPNGMSCVNNSNRRINHDHLHKAMNCL